MEENLKRLDVQTVLTASLQVSNLGWPITEAQTVEKLPLAIYLNLVIVLFSLKYLSAEFITPSRTNI